MSRVPHLRRMLIWERWANREFESVLLGMGAGPGERVPVAVLRYWGHLAGAHELWLSRVEGRAPLIEVWPTLSAADSAKHLERTLVAWIAHADAWSDEDLEREIAYVNSRGEPWSSTIADILAHITHHSAWHRGQIARVLRETGVPPPYVDYIEAARRGKLEE